MTITLAAVYTPIGFQGGLTGSLFLEFAITLAAAVVVSGIVAVTLSPAMSMKFVHAHGEEGRLTRWVNHAFDWVRDRYARLLDGALQIRWAIVAASLLIMAAAWPLYMFSRKELAPVEDQTHISLFLEAPPDASLAATNRSSLEVVKAIRSFPETEFMWSLTANWGGFGGLVAKDWHQRKRSTEQMYGEVFGKVSQIPGLRVFPRLDPPLPTPGQYDVELVLQSELPPEQMLETVGKVVGAGWASGKFLYVDTDLKIDLPEARVVIDREQVADLGLDLASVGQELGTLLGRRVREPVQLLRPELQGHPADRREGSGDGRTAARPQDQDAHRRAGAGVDVHQDRVQHRAADAEPVPAAERGAGVRRRAARGDEGRGTCGCWSRPRRRRADRASCSTTPASRARSGTRVARWSSPWASP